MVPVQSQFTDIAILVPSCDRYSSLWPYTVGWILKNEVLSELPLYVSSNSLRALGAISLAVGTQRSWSEELLIALQKIPQAHIILILDDLISSNYQVSDSQLRIAIQTAFKESYDYLRLVDLRNKSSIAPSKQVLFSQISSEFPYRLSLLPAVWKKSTLQSLLQSCESAWDFERKGSARSRKYINWMTCSTTVIGTYNLIIKGKCYSRDLQRSGIPRTKLSFPSQNEMEGLLFGLNVIKHKLWIQILHYWFALKY